MFSSLVSNAESSYLSFPGSVESSCKPLYLLRLFLKSDIYNKVYHYDHFK